MIACCVRHTRKSGRLCRSTRHNEKRRGVLDGPHAAKRYQHCKDDSLRYRMDLRDVLINRYRSMYSVVCHQLAQYVSVVIIQRQDRSRSDVALTRSTCRLKPTGSWILSSSCLATWKCQSRCHYCTASGQRPEPLATTARQKTHGRIVHGPGS